MVTRDATRLALEEETVGRGLATLVLTVVELLRRLMEQQALRRVDEGDLSEEQIEKLGSTLMALEEAMVEVCGRFGLTLADVDIDLGPLGPLLGPACPQNDCHDHRDGTPGTAPDLH
ncbi:gas vesicle protein K [Actinoplanes sp. NPDC049548]|uniref:gas vesicle protein K n=1 Tax=Actinoplanes sp. NPDC049548 TaxID=3155152 RepID=UPI00344A3429